jgi:hypothetical protein
VNICTESSDLSTSEFLLGDKKSLLFKAQTAASVKPSIIQNGQTVKLLPSSQATTELQNGGPFNQTAVTNFVNTGRLESLCAPDD